MPHRKNDGTIELDVSKWDSMSVNYLEIYDVLFRYDEFVTNIPTFEQLISKAIAVKTASGKGIEICPIGLMTDRADRLMLIEAMCEKYKCLPYIGTSLESQPLWAIDAFMVISIAKDKYTTRKMEFERLKAKQKHGR